MPHRTTFAFIALAALLALAAPGCGPVPTHENDGGPSTSDAGDKSNGLSCSGDGDCRSGICAGGHCCGTACGPCGDCSTGSCVATSCGSDGGSGGDGGNPGSDGGNPGGAANGAHCVAPGDCSSGHCVGDVCCNSDCGNCGVCSTGTCQNVDAGAAGTPSCAPYACSGTSPTCPTSCLDDTTCAAGTFCQNGACVRQLPDETPCTARTNARADSAQRSTGTRMATGSERRR